MGVAQQALAGAGGGFTPLAGATTLNPSAKSASMTLSNGSLTCASTTTAQWVRSIASKSSGLIYFEVRKDVYSGPNQSRIGMRTSGSTQTAASPESGFAWAFGGGSVSGGGGTYSAFVSGVTSPDTVDVVAMFAVDITNSIVWLGSNGTWATGHDPVAKTGGFTFAGSGGLTLFAHVLHDGNNKTHTFNFGATPFVYSAPTGFTPGFA